MINEPTPDAEATFRRRPLDCFPHATLPTRVPPFWPIVTLPTRKSDLVYPTEDALTTDETSEQGVSLALGYYDGETFVAA